MKRLADIFKDPASGLIHLASAVAALAGAIALWQGSPPVPARRFSFLVYGLSVVMLFSASAAYHLIRTSPRWELLLRRLDHTAIFLLIAGTYTPVCVVVLRGGWGTALLVAIWSLAAAGMLLHLVFIERLSRWLTIALYVLMGWLGVIGVVPLTRALPLAGVMWLAAGGFAYTAGAIVYASRKLDLFPGTFGFHEVWHVFVTAAAACHFVMIARYVLPLA
jgi:hemolysin III